MFTSTPFVLASFKFINKCACFDYGVCPHGQTIQKINKQDFEMKPARMARIFTDWGRC